MSVQSIMGATLNRRDGSGRVSTGVVTGSESMFVYVWCSQFGVFRAMGVLR